MPAQEKKCTVVDVFLIFLNFFYLLSLARQQSTACVPFDVHVRRLIFISQGFLFLGRIRIQKKTFANELSQAE